MSDNTLDYAALQAEGDAMAAAYLRAVPEHSMSTRSVRDFPGDIDPAQAWVDMLLADLDDALQRRRLDGHGQRIIPGSHAFENGPEQSTFDLDSFDLDMQLNGTVSLKAIESDSQAKVKRTGRIEIDAEANWRYSAGSGESVECLQNFQQATPVGSLKVALLTRLRRLDRSTVLIERYRVHNGVLSESLSWTLKLRQPKRARYTQ